MNYYDIYEVEYRFKSDIEFIEKLMRNGSVLEVGCGSGRVLSYLKNTNNYLLYGLDIDEDAILIAKDKFINDDINITVDNAITFNHKDKYMNILFLFNGLMQIKCDAEQVLFLKNAYRHLKDNGVLLFYISNPDINRMSESFSYYKFQKTLTIGDVLVDKFECNKYDLDRQLIHRIFNYDYVDGDGFLRRTTSRFTVRYLFKKELELMLKEAGFDSDSIDIFGDFDGSEWYFDSPHIIIKATK